MERRMVRLQHQFRRGPGEGITVGSTRYLLDDQGIVEVTEEHAGYMLAGKGTQWAPPGTWPPLTTAMPQEAVGPAGRRPRTRQEMHAAAVMEGLVEAPQAPESPQEPPTRLPGAEDTVGLNAGVMADHPEARESESDTREEETIEISPTTPLPQLKKVAAQLGVIVPKKVTQAQLFDLLQAQGERE